MHDVLIVGVQLIAILAGILFNRAGFKDLRRDTHDMRSDIKNLRADHLSPRGEMREGFARIHADIAVLRSEMRQFYHLTAS